VTENPLVNLEKLSAPVTKLVEVVAAGVGALYEPLGVVRKAKANAKAAVIRARADAEVATIEQRAKARLEHREATRQENIERVTAIAASELPDSVSSAPVDPDWTAQYFNHAQDVSDADLQVLWGRILAGEVAKPGSYSKRTLGFLGTLEKWEAQGFTDLCAFAFKDKSGWHYVFRCKAYFEALRARFGMRDVEGHFTTIGLLRSETGMPNPSELNGTKGHYFEEAFEVAAPPAPTAKGGIAMLEIGPSVRNFSLIGQQLAKISGAKPAAGYLEKMSTCLNKEFQIRLVRTAT
jgi:hypothetical protein